MDDGCSSIRAFEYKSDPIIFVPAPELASGEVVQVISQTTRI
jgi:hypothetical protein